MNSQGKDQHSAEPSPGIANYVSTRIVVSVVAIVAVVWLLNLTLDRLNEADRHQTLGPKTTLQEPQKPTHTNRQSDQMAVSDSHVDTKPKELARKPLAGIGSLTISQAMPDTVNGIDPASETFAEQVPKLLVRPLRQPTQPLLTGSTPDLILHAPKNLTDDTPGNHMAKADSSHAPSQIQAEKKAPPAPSHNERQDATKQQILIREDSETNPVGRQPDRGPATDQSHEPPVTKPSVKQAHPGDTAHEQLPAGIAFVDAVIKPIEYELKHRFWRWRPNDIINLTDNINNYQLGVLEVTRRTVVQLAQRISRTGSTDAFNPHLEKAMNWLMVKADRYWFPAPESKYKESLKELEAYKKMLLAGEGSFYIRTDNIIPLLTAYEDLLGSCDENLVKSKEDDGKAVSTFKADDYFYYAKGVAKAMAVILEAVHHDFSRTLESRNGSELLHHAIVSCQSADKLYPLFIMNSDLDGIFANHRANMAALISHARFYISQLIKTLST